MVIEIDARDPSTKRLAFYCKDAALEIGVRLANGRIRWIGRIVRLATRPRRSERDNPKRQDRHDKTTRCKASCVGEGHHAGYGCDSRARFSFPLSRNHLAGSSAETAFWKVTDLHTAISGSWVASTQHSRAILRRVLNCEACCRPIVTSGSTAVNSLSPGRTTGRGWDPGLRQVVSNPVDPGV